MWCTFVVNFVKIQKLVFFPLQHKKPSTYDRINHVVEGYNQKLHRDDREHAKSRGLKVNSEVSIFFPPFLVDPRLMGDLQYQLGLQAMVVQKVDNAIRWINLYPLDSAIGFPDTFPLYIYLALSNVLTTRARTTTNLIHLFFYQNYKLFMGKLQLISGWTLPWTASS